MANLLIVDDEQSMRDMLGIVFRDEGHEVFEAADGKEGIEAFQENEIDLVVQDLRMPRMDGLQLLQALKDSNSDVPVIVITAFGDWQSAVEAMRLGAFDDWSDGADLERALVRQKSPHLLRNPGPHFRRNFGYVLQAVRTRHVGHLCLMLNSLFRALERRGQIENGPAVLNCNDTPYREAAAVTCAVYFVNDRCGHVTAP